MSSPISQGLVVSFWGLLLTFTAIGLLSLILVGTDRLFRSKPGGDEEGEEAEGGEQGEALAVAEEEAGDDEAVVVAIAAALQAVQTRRGVLGTALEAGPGAWWFANRYTQK